MKNKIFLGFIIISISLIIGCINLEQKTDIDITIKDRQILINGDIFFIKGVGYAPVPIGDNPNKRGNADYFTSDYEDIYNRDLLLIRQMGANTIRLWGWRNNENHSDFLSKAYNNGKGPIYIIVGFWINSESNLSSPDIREEIKSDFKKMVSKNKDNPAILMWVIGNELNRGRNKEELDDIFSLINEMAGDAHLEEGDNHRPVTTTLQDTNIIGSIRDYDQKMDNLDIWSAQLYRGKTFGRFFKDYSEVSSKPLIITEFGIDAYDERRNIENEEIQSKYIESLWNDIVNNSNMTIGGAVTTYSDGWWISEKRLTDCNDNNASIQGNCGYVLQSSPDKFANDEWWGIMRIKKNGSNRDTIEPRKAYYKLKDLWTKH